MAKRLKTVVKDITKRCNTTEEDALLLLNNSNDYTRDSKIVKRLSNIGLEPEVILAVINTLNT